MIALLIALQFAAATPQPAVTEPQIDAAVTAWLSERLKDPSSAIIERRGHAKPGTYTTGGGLFGGQRSTRPAVLACYRVNARNSYGGYAGASDYLFTIVDGAIMFTRESPYYNSYAHRQIEDYEVTSNCTAAELTRVGAPRDEVSSSASDLKSRVGRLVASGQCDEAKSEALKAGDFDLAERAVKICTPVSR